MTDNPRAEVPVTQADREAAAASVRWQQAMTREWNADAFQFFAGGFADGIERGTWDEHEVVQAFARHRIDALAQPVAGEGEAELVAALERLDEARKGWEAGERIDGDDAACVLRLGTVKPIERAARAYLASSPDHSALVRDLVEALDSAGSRLGGAAGEIARLRAVAKLPVVELKGIAATRRVVDAALAAAKQVMGALSPEPPPHPGTPVVGEQIGTSDELRTRLGRMSRGEHAD